MSVIAGIIGSAAAAAKGLAVAKVATGLSAAAGLTSSGINALMQARTNAMNKQQADEAYRRQVEAIKEQNIYNSPAMQVARMKAAGLNPALAYGADGALVGEQTDIPAYSPIPAESPNVGNLSSILNGSIEAGLQIRDQENRDNLALSQMALNSANAFLAYTTGDFTKEQRRFLLETWDLKIEELESANSLTWENLLKARQDISESKSRIRLNDKEIEALASQINVNAATIRRILALLPHEIMNMDADTALKYMQTEVGKAQIAQIGALITLTHSQTLDTLVDSWYKGESINLQEKAYELQKDWNKHAKRLGWFQGAENGIMDVSKTILGVLLLGGFKGGSSIGFGSAMGLK